MSRQLTQDQKKALNFTNHITLTANAGSGKTFVLTNRFIEILARTETSLNEIAAITFTEKAAGELYTKISKSIFEASTQTKNPDERKKYDNFKKQLVSANISTIHSFCAQILREFPVEASIDAGFTPMDAQTSEEYIGLAINELVKQVDKNTPLTSLIKEMIRYFGSRQSLSNALEKAISQRGKIKFLVSKVYSENEESIAAYFTSFVEKNLKEMFLHQLASFIKSVSVINKAAEQKGSDTAIVIKQLLASLNRETEVIRTFDLLFQIKEQLLTKQGTVRKTKYLGNQPPEELLGDIDFVENYFAVLPAFDHLENIAQLHLRLASFGKKFLSLHSEVLLSYEAKKQEMGYLDFEDILLKTQQILELPEVRHKLSKKFRYLMVDEYQDTNEIQYEIFLPILERLKTGNLFIVGDEKQSIYKFREAELSVFSKTKGDVLEHDGLSLSLPASFRMSPQLCAFTNTLFRVLFANPNTRFNEVEHIDLVCAKKEQSASSIELLVAEKNEETGDTEAELVAKRIIKLSAEGCNFSEIAILCRKRSSFEELEQAFQKMKIPYQIWEGKGFYQQQIIFDFYNYLSFISNPTDDTALVGILRSPFYLLSDSLLLEVSLQPGSTFWQKLQNASHANILINNVVTKLGNHLAQLPASEPASLLRTIAHDTRYLSLIAARENGAKELANFEKLVQVTRGFYSQGFRSIYDYLSYLSEAIADSSEEGQAESSTDDNKVRIMTVHQAKGLEFKTVIIFGCHKEGVRPQLNAKDLQVDKEFGVMAKLPPTGNFSLPYENPPIVSLFNLDETKKEFAELKRLFYVAVTRASDNLIFSATLNMQSLKIPACSFLHLLTSGLSINFQDDSIEGSIDLTYQKTEDGTEIKSVLPTPFAIKIIKQFDATQPSESVFRSELKPYTLRLESEDDCQKEEIISATKVAIYNQCPTKYQLTYNFGYNALTDVLQNSLDNKENEFDFNESEGDEPQPENLGKSIQNISLVRGKLIHQILEKNIPPEGITSFVTTQLTTQKVREREIKFLVEAIRADIQSWYDSPIYKELLHFPHSKNEFQIYRKVRDFYLFGIADKVIFNENEIILVDYKTDNIEAAEISSRAEEYQFQLTFYAYLLNKLFPEYSSILLQLIFIKHPTIEVKKKLSTVVLASFEKMLFAMIDEIRKNNFSKNHAHCSKCHFSDYKNNCIFQQV